MLKGFFRLNIAASDWLERQLPSAFTRSLLYLHELTAARLAAQPSVNVVLDVGGGHSSPFATREGSKTLVIGADILYEQVIENHDVDAGVVCDACQALPFSSGSIDLITTRSVLEHLPSNDAFVSECARVLKSGGRVAHVFPAKRAPFALLNRVLPNWLVRRLVRFYFPQWADECGFRAYYDKCGYPEMAALHTSKGFVLEEVQLRYYQSIYFKPFFPVYTLFVAYDLLIWLSGIKWLCCQLLIVARRS